jgi:hypothetical protein
MSFWLKFVWFILWMFAIEISNLRWPLNSGGVARNLVGGGGADLCLSYPYPMGGIAIHIYTIQRIDLNAHLSSAR